MRKVKDLTGSSFGDILVIGPFKRIRKKIYWFCKCSCGEEKYIRACSLRHRADCGHRKREDDDKRFKEMIYKHGMSGSRFHNAWKNMKRRCSSSKSKKDECYRKKNITVCDRWLNFENFRDDMYEEYQRVIEGIPNCQIDRINGNDGYYKENCRWVSPLENSRNIDKTSQRKFGKEQILEIRKLYRNGSSTYKLERIYGASSATIWNIAKYKTYKDID